MTDTIVRTLRILTYFALVSWVPLFWIADVNARQQERNVRVQRITVVHWVFLRLHQYQDSEEELLTFLLI